MENKKKKKISKRVVVTLIVIVAAAVLISLYLNGRNISEERDEYGCLSAGGYSYDSEVGACTRGWEVSEENDKRAAKSAVDSIGVEGLTIVEVIGATCYGCYLVRLEKEEVITEIVLSNWEKRTKDLSADECFALGTTAKLVKTEDGCSEDETNFGNVISFNYPKICCVA